MGCYMRNKEINWGYFYILLAAVLFSSMEVAMKFVVGQFNPIQMTFSRFFVGGAVLLPMAIHMLKKCGEKLSGKDVGIFAVLGFLGIAAGMSLFQMAVPRIDASVISVLYSSNPVFVTFFAFLLLRETITRNQVLGLLLDLLGILCIIDPLNMKMDVLGIVLLMSSVLLFSLYSVCNKPQCHRFGSVVVTCFSFLFGAAELMLMAALTHISTVAHAMENAGMSQFVSIPFFEGYSVATIPAILLIFVANTGLGYTFYFTAMEKTSAQKANLVFFLKPVLAPLLAFLILHETIQTNRILGIFLILCGSVVSVWSGKAMPKKTKK